MNKSSEETQPASNMITFYHDIEQDLGMKADSRECRQVVKEFLKQEKRYNVPVTYNIAGRLFREQPDLIDWIIQEGQEVAFYSCNHESGRNGTDPEEIDLCRQASTLPHGYHSLGSRPTGAVLKRLWESGFLWDAEFDRHEQPYFVYKGLVRIPISLDDRPLHTGRQSAAEWIDQFRDLLKKKRYVACGSHDSITSLAPDERLRAWEEVLKIAVQNKALLADFSETADLFRRAVLSRCFDIFAGTFNRGTKEFYHTKRFSELILAEAEKIKKPVVADLASGGGALSSHLRGMAKKIYCVDNSAGMVADIDKDNVVEVRFGEATDTDLPHDSIDLVICARFMGYLSRPDLLAEEIKRIGKAGATYIVTFRGNSEDIRLNRRFSANKIRRFFTPAEIKAWAEQIGPYRLIGVQYEMTEPDSAEMERRYREIEKNPTPDKQPEHWVLIGTVQNKSISIHRRKVIPISAFKFRFGDMWFDWVGLSVQGLGRYFPKSVRRLGASILHH